MEQGEKKDKKQVLAQVIHDFETYAVCGNIELHYSNGHLSKVFATKVY